MQAKIVYNIQTDIFFNFAKRGFTESLKERKKKGKKRKQEIEEKNRTNKFKS